MDNNLIIKKILDSEDKIKQILETPVDLSNYVQKEVGKGLFSGNYNDLTNKLSTTDDLPESATKKYVSPTQTGNWDNHLTDKTNPHEVAIEQVKNISINTPTDKQTLMYDVAISKWTNTSTSLTDEKVKASSTGTSQYLDAIVDGTTCVIDSNKLIVKSLQGQNVSIAEINTLQGMDTNIKTLFNTLASAGMTYTGIVGTKALLNAVVGATVGNVKIVLVDETQANKRMAYIYSDTGTWESVGEANITQRDFSTNPIKLGGADKEVVGVLEQVNMDLAGIVKTSDLANYTTTTDLQSTYVTKMDVSTKANSVDVYSKTEADTLLGGKANSSHTHTITDVSSLQYSLDGKVDKVTGKSLIDDSEITRLSTVTNYDHTSVDNHIADNDIHVTSDEKTKLYNTSGTNTGDETQTTIKTKLGQATTTTDGYLSSTDWNTFNGIKQISNPNLLINGGFQVWQRGTSGFSSGVKKYTADRWAFFKIAWDTGATVEKLNSSYGSEYLIKSIGNIANPPLVQQILDIETSKSLLGKKLTFSIKARTGSGISDTNLQIKIGCYKNSDVAVGNGFSYDLSTHTTIKYITSSIQTYSYTTESPIPYDTDYVSVYVIAGINGTTAEHYVALSEAKLEVGTIVTPFYPRLYAEELALCERYYEKSKAMESSMSPVNGSLAGFSFKTEKRVLPKVTIGKIGAMTISAWSGNLGGTNTVGNIGVDVNGVKYIDGMSSSEILANNTYIYSWVADAEIL